MKTKEKEKTPFELAQIEVAEGRLQAPSVNAYGKKVDYFAFQLASHHFYMKIFASGMVARQINLKTLKQYYGLKSKSAKDCLVEFEKILNDYFFNEQLKRNSQLN